MIPFHKVSGSGNDFIALAEPDRAPSAAEIRAWCARGASVGADGLFVLRREGGGVAMDYWNADGRPADLCLNGTRCAARLAFHLGWAAGTARIATGAGGVTAHEAGAAEVAVEVPPPAAPPRAMAVEVAGEHRRGWEGWFLEVGVPHFTLLWPESLARAPVAELGKALRLHEAFGAAGANVSFVRFPEAHRLEIRTFERGVEAETLSCGTGVLAATATGLALGIAELPLAVATQGGFELEVSGEADRGLVRRWTLAGDARVVARGELLPGAAVVPATRPWAA